LYHKSALSKYECLSDYTLLLQILVKMSTAFAICDQIIVVVPKDIVAVVSKGSTVHIMLLQVKNRGEQTCGI